MEARQGSKQERRRAKERKRGSESEGEDEERKGENGKLEEWKGEGGGCDIASCLFFSPAGDAEVKGRDAGRGEGEGGSWCVGLRRG